MSCEHCDNVLNGPHSDQPQQPQDDRPTARHETPETRPATDHKIAKDITAERAPAEENEAADGPTAFDPPPQDPATPSAGTDVDQGPLEVADVAPPSDTVELGAQVVDEPIGDQPRTHDSPSPAPVENSLNVADDDVAPPPEVAWSSADKAPADDPGSAWPRADAVRPDAAEHVGSQVPSDLAWSEVIRSFGIEPSEGESGVPGGLTAIDPATPPPGLVEIPIVRPGERPRIERLPFLDGEKPEGPAVRYLAESDEPLDTASATAAQSREADMGPRTQGFLSPTSDGGPPLARPMVLVNLPDAQILRINEEALTAAAARDETTLDKIAEAKVDHAFWVRACHERAVWGNY